MKQIQYLIILSRTTQNSLYLILDINDVPLFDVLKEALLLAGTDLEGQFSFGLAADAAETAPNPDGRFGDGDTEATE